MIIVMLLDIIIILLMLFDIFLHETTSQALGAFLRSVTIPFRAIFD
jgi:hypothetical protein